MRVHRIALILILTLCLGTHLYSENCVQKIESDYVKIIHEDENVSDYCTIYELEPSNNLKYQYQLLDDEGNVLFEDTTFRLPPDISFISEKILSIRINAGTGVYYNKFYDIENQNISEYFYAPYTTFENNVVSVQYSADEGKCFLIVQDMFNENEMYVHQEIDIANSSFPNVSIVDIKFLDDKKFWIQYETSGDRGIIENIISFS